MIEDLKPYPETKDSGLTWLGEIPAHWEIKRNGSLFLQRNAVGEPDWPILEVSLRTGVRIREFGSSKRKQVMSDKAKYKCAAKGDYVYNMMRMWQGAAGIAPVDGLVSPAYVVAKPLPHVNPAYFASLFRTDGYLAEIDAFSRGIVKDRNRLYWDQFKQIPTPCPPTEEQAAIARFLAWATNRLDRAIRAKRRIIALLNEQKQAIIHRAVTRGLDPSVPLRDSGISWLGEIPEHWEVRRAKQLCLGIVDCKNRTPELVEGGEFSVVRTTNIRNGTFNPKGSYSTNRHNFEVWTQRGAPKLGDVFFTREAPVGEACLVPDRMELCMGQRMMYFRPDPDVLDAGFMLNSIYGPVVRKYIEIQVNGSTVGHLRLGQVSALPLLWCPVAEQKAIVAHIDKLNAPMATAIAGLEQEITFLSEYRTRLIADVVTGRLDVCQAASGLPEAIEPLHAGDTGDEFEELEPGEEEDPELP